MDGRALPWFDRERLLEYLSDWGGDPLERYRRLVKRRGKLKALVAVARSILVIVWHLLADPTTRFHDLGPDYHTTRVNTDRKIRNLVRQLEALGHHVTLQPAA